MKNLKAFHFINTPVVCAYRETSVLDILNKLIKIKSKGMPIVNRDKSVVGVVFQKDILALVFQGKDLNIVEAGRLASLNVLTADISASITAIMKTLVLEDLEMIPITEKDKLVGAITNLDILKTISNRNFSGFTSIEKEIPSLLTPTLALKHSRSSF